MPATPTEPSEQPSEQPSESPTTSPDGIPQTYLDRGWDSWPTVAINLESIIHESIDERDAALSKLDTVERRSVTP